MVILLKKYILYHTIFQHKIISAEYSFLLTYFTQKHIIISEMGNHRQESSCQTVGNFKIEG